MPNDAIQARIPIRKRVDLVIRRQDDGRWVVKDPLSLQYSLLDDEEMSVLRSLNGQASMGSILRTLQTGWPDKELTVGDIRELLQQFVASQLVTGSIRPTSELASSASVMKWLVRLSGWLRIRLPLLNPDPILERLRPGIRLVFHPVAAGCFAVLAVIATTAVFIRFGDFLNSLPTVPDIFSAESIIGIVLSFIVVKALHECGHACAAKHFGAECNEAGIWLLLLTPVLYTNVTDAWLLDRRRRMLVTAAGMLTEVVIASAAAVVWCFAAPGVLRTQLANIVVLCTVSTVLFNGNPLLRYDGYFLLTDALGIPNLAQRSSVRVRDAIERLLLGPQDLSDAPTTIVSQHAPADSHVDPFSGRGQRVLILTYGVVSLLYRTLITFGILSLLMRMFDRWNLRVLGLGLVTFGVISMIAVPWFQNTAAFLAAMASRPNPRRSVVRTALILSAGLILMFVPLPHSLILPAVVEPAGTPIFASLSGQLQQAAPYGTRLRQGDVIAVLTETRLQRELLRLRSDVETRELQLRAMELSRDTAVHGLIPEAKKSLEATRNRRAQFEKEIERLKIRASSDGILLPPRPRPRQTADDDLPAWIGIPLSAENLGAFVSEGTLLGYLDSSSSPLKTEAQAPSTSQSASGLFQPVSQSNTTTRAVALKRMKLLLTLSDRDRQMVAPNQTVDFSLTGNPGMILRGIVRQVASLQVSEVPGELVAAGLDIDTRTTASQKPVRRWQALVDVILPDQAPVPVLYSTGLARVHIAPSSTASRLSVWLHQTFP
jgi:putative peptide zinc metalloprotease protein